MAAVPQAAVMATVGQSDRRVERRLQHTPAEQAALLPVWCELSAEQAEHVGRGQLPHVGERLAMDSFDEHRGGSLADAAAIAVEPGVGDSALGIDTKFHPHHVTAKRVVIFVAMRCVGAGAAMERFFVMFENSFLVNVVGRLAGQRSAHTLSLDKRERRDNRLR